MAVICIGLLFGAFIGSFLNVCIHRLPRNESIVQPPSRCYSCGTQVQWYDNLPVIGYLVLRGRCRWCGASFSIRYMVMEVLVAVLTAAVLWLVFVWQPEWIAPTWLPKELHWLSLGLAAASLLAIVYYLVVSALIDLEYMIIPDELTKSFQVIAPFLGICSGLVMAFGWNAEPWLKHETAFFGQFRFSPNELLGWTIGIAAACLLFILASIPLARAIYSKCCPANQRWSDADHRGYAVGKKWFVVVSVPALIALCLMTFLFPSGEAPVWHPAVSALATAILGSLTGWLSLDLIGLVGTPIFRRNAMGFGDVKFLAPIGAMVGPVGIGYIIFFAACVGTLVGIPLRLRGHGREIPFGPYLAAGTLLVLFIGPEFHRALMQHMPWAVPLTP